MNPLQSGQNTVIMPNATVVFSVDGGRTRSNNFTIDGQDVNNIHLGGEDQRLNNPDAIAEFRLVTNSGRPGIRNGRGRHGQYYHQERRQPASRHCLLGS